jgi:hypothetical protein
VPPGQRRPPDLRWPPGSRRTVEEEDRPLAYETDAVQEPGEPLEWPRPTHECITGPRAHALTTDACVADEVDE